MSRIPLCRFSVGGTPVPPSADRSIKDRVFLFGAVERIRETRQSNFQYPEDFPLALKRIEESIDRPGEVYETRGFAKLDEVLGHHRLTEELNLTDQHSCG